MQASPVKARRGRKAAAATSTPLPAEKEKVTVDKAVTAEEPAEEAPKSTRGRRIAKKTEPQAAAAPAEETPATVKRAARGRKAKVAESEEADTPAAGAGPGQVGKLPQDVGRRRLPSLRRRTLPQP